MVQILLELPIQRKRDLFLARQRGRQIASLLNLERDRQTSIAAAVFEMAAQVCGKKGAKLRFQLTDNGFQVLVLPRSPLCLDVPLTTLGSKLDCTDLTWAVQELHRNTPLDITEEARHQNRELLRVMQELESARVELVGMRGPGLRGAA